MTDPQAAAGPASASGVRRMGDEYQDLAAWAAAVRLVHPGSKYAKLQMEMNQQGNLDDVVLRTIDPDVAGDLFQQLKWTTSESNFLDEDYMTKVPSGSARSLLKKLYDAYNLINDAAGQAPFEMQLHSNRPADPAHPLLSRIDGRTGLLVPFAANATAGSNAGKSLAGWAAHLGVDREHVLAMLFKLRFRAGRDIAGERDNAKVLMLAAGLANDDSALDAGVAAAGAWVRDGRREVTKDDVLEAATRLGLVTTQPTATLLIDDIDHDLAPEAATVTLDWVSHYDDAHPIRRRIRRTPELNRAAANELAVAAADIEMLGYRRVYVRGHFRQASAFLAGASFPKTRGFELEYMQGLESWKTDALRESPHLDERRVDVDQGPDLAVLVAPTVEATGDVLRFIGEAQLPVGGLIAFTPAAGEHDGAVRGAGHAVGIAGEVRQRVRRSLGQGPTDARVHLFLAGPNGLALFLGHRWNAVAPTITYEHRGIGSGYAATFAVEA